MAAPDIALNGSWGGGARPQFFQFFAGGDRVLEVTVTDPAAANGLKDLTGAGAKWILAEDNTGSVLLTKILAAGVTIPVGTDGKFRVTIDDTDSTNLVGDYYHEAQVTDASGAVVTVMHGAVKILASVFLAVSAATLLGIAGSADDPYGMVIEDTFVVS